MYYTLRGIIIEGMARTITGSQLRKILGKEIEKSNTVVLAKKWNCSQSYLYRAWKGEKPIGPKLARKLGFKAISDTFQKV